VKPYLRSEGPEVQMSKDLPRDQDEGGRVRGDAYTRNMLEVLESRS
jgi:hypothetical protein